MTHASLRRFVAASLTLTSGLGAALGASLASPAFAADPRLVAHEYREDEVVPVYGHAGVQATIAFGAGEAIENVAIGDSAQWQITPNKRADLLFVKPLEVSARTNMTVVTNKHTYFFDLIASPRAKPLYMLRFTYQPEPEAPPERPEGAARFASLDPAERAIAEGDPLSMPADAAALNFAWKREGDARLEPARVYDDGVSTYLVWPQLSEVPAILVRNEAGEEGPVNYAVRGPTIVVADVPDRIVLRRGKAVAELVNALPLSARTAPRPETAPASGGGAGTPALSSAAPAPSATTLPAN
ncbi:TrbG/VirB9 family P-type conjugative transfer protein [Novosphingobium sp. 1949]|uniref:TrbG/VirB9 family P-type conjugative transfer protein n=1 Tax=Novosphingobium organovorum TaxID=2930092 RepID=A0ABT0BJA2_9SPHN|nr:TrbG/VirB9 family P-type conjugative transfer protein [Novosphingobium organovorum]MCJ2185132.1 TrbG/VirB9 family P-type conjugative transfer protein [Novosphingobium organovorum]